MADTSESEHHSHNQSDLLLSTGDKVLRTVGTVKLWWDIIKGCLIILLIIVLAVGIAQYHARWKADTFSVKDITCAAPHTVTSCNNNGSCSNTSLSECTITLDGFKQTFSSSYKAGVSPPTAGQTVKVFYNPRDRSDALLARDDFVDDHKTVLITVLAIVMLLVLVGVVVQFVVRKSHLAQRVAGGTAVFSLASGQGF